MTNTGKKILFVLLAINFFFGWSVVSADYLVAQNAYTVNQNAWSVGGWTAFDYIATSTATQVDRIDLNACVNGSIGGGEVVSMGIYQKTPYAYTHIASSSLTLAGNVLDCSVVSATTTVTFVFDTNLQWVSGANLYFVLYSSNATSNFRLQAQPYGADNWALYSSSTSALPSYPYTNINPDYIGISAKIRGLGFQPTEGNIYNASSTTVICETFDVGCYVSSAFSWAFTIPEGSFDRFSTLKDDIKDHAPFGYFSSAYNTIGGLTGTSTPAFGLATSSPIMALVFTPLRSGLSWLILIAGLFWLYKRLSNIHI